MTPLIRKPRRTACAALALLTCVIPAVRSADLDSDGLSDVCQQPYGAEALEMNTDADHDGFSNFSESVAGTNPFIATDHLLAGPLEVAPGGDPVQLDFPSRSAKWYQVVESADLLSFAPLGPRLAGDEPGQPHPQRQPGVLQTGRDRPPALGRRPRQYTQRPDLPPDFSRYT